MTDRDEQLLYVLNKLVLVVDKMKEILEMLIYQVEWGNEPYVIFPATK